MDGIDQVSMQQMLPQVQPADYLRKNQMAQRQIAEDLELRKATTEFEAVLTSTILKEGMNSAMEMNSEDRDNGSKTYMEIANEQMSLFVGRSGMIGIGDQLYRDIKLRQNGGM
tara:strand:+ start:47 stop:385 length:339 start_codon:yes stop_codon:yes gene_type:complete